MASVTSPSLRRNLTRPVPGGDAEDPAAAVHGEELQQIDHGHLLEVAAQLLIEGDDGGRSRRRLRDARDDVIEIGPPHLRGTELLGGGPGRPADQAQHGDVAELRDDLERAHHVLLVVEALVDQDHVGALLESLLDGLEGVAGVGHLDAAGAQGRGEHPEGVDVRVHQKNAPRHAASR